MLKQKVILDVDVGTDDAVALLLFFFAEVLGMIKIEAITTVNGNTKIDYVTSNVMRILEIIDRTDIPVYKGAHEPFIDPELKGDGYHGKDGFGDLNWKWFPNMDRLKPEIASVAIGRIVRENPDEIIVIATGPLTNIALTTMLYPDFYAKLKELYVMGGNFNGVGNIVPAAEFNFYLDPESAHRVLNKTIKPITILPWEACTAMNISSDWRWNELGKIKNPLLDVIGQAEEDIYPAKSKTYNPPDALLAAAFLFKETAIAKEVLEPADVELRGTLTRGQVAINHRNDTTPNVIMIEQINEEVFKKLLQVAALGTQKSFAPKCKN